MLPDMNSEQEKRFWEFVNMNDFEFFEEFIADLPDDAQINFFEETPDFLSDYMDNDDKPDLENDDIYQNIMKKVRQLEKKNGKPVRE